MEAVAGVVELERRQVLVGVGGRRRVLCGWSGAWVLVVAAVAPPLHCGCVLMLVPSWLCTERLTVLILLLLVFSHTSTMASSFCCFCWAAVMDDDGGVVRDGVWGICDDRMCSV